MATWNKYDVTVLPQSSFSTQQKAVARNNIGALGIDEYNSDVELFNNVYDTVSSNSATWNEGGSPEVSCENFVEWNFNRQSTDDMLANPLLALCDTSGTPSGTLNAGDKYMIYVDGLLGQSGNSNNTFANFGIQSGTVSGQYLLPEPLPSKKLCRSTSTGNDFACAYMFTVPTNGVYSVAVQPTDNNNEYKFFGNTTIRQIKIG